MASDNKQSQLEPADAVSALRGMPFTRGVASLGPSLERPVRDLERYWTLAGAVVVRSAGQQKDNFVAPRESGGRSSAEPNFTFDVKKEFAAQRVRRWAL